MTLRLPDEMRSELKDPLGRVSPEVERESLEDGRVVAVGDMVTYHLVKSGIVPDIAVVDGRTERQEVDREVVDRWSEIQVTARVENEPGTISGVLVEALKQAFKEKGLVEVEGEEDLAVLPAVALASEGDTVLYGQPGEGMVYVDVDDETHSHVLDLLGRMEGDDKILSGLRNS